MFSVVGCKMYNTMDKENPVNHTPVHAALYASFKRAEVEAAHKLALVKAAANKGPKAIAVAVEVAAKAAKRRDSLAKKLSNLGVSH